MPKHLTRDDGIIPDYRQVRDLIKDIPEKPYRLGAMYGYLIAARASEIVSKRCPSDTKTTPRGPTGRDHEINQYRTQDGEIVDVLVLHVKTSKRDGLPRAIGVPLHRENFAEPVYDYFQEHGPDEALFPYTRQDLHYHTKDTFKGYIYPIEPYKIREIDQRKYSELLNRVPVEIRGSVKPPSSVVSETKVPRHYRRLALHGSMRHYRTMELAQRYGFSKEERDIYTGHTTSGVDDRYSHLNWRAYFPKLLYG